MTIKKSPRLAEVKLKYQCQQPLDERPQVASPAEAEEMLRKIWNTDHIELKEEFVVLL